MKRFLVLMAYVDRGESKAGLMHFWIEASSEDEAEALFDERLHDRTWCAKLLESDLETLDCEPLFDDGVDRAIVEIIAADDLQKLPLIAIGA